MGVEGMLAIDAEWVADQARCLLEDMPVDAFKIGVLGSVENIAAIAEIVSDYPDVPLVLDPVLASGRGDELATEEMTRGDARAAAAADHDPHAEQPRGAPARRRRGRRHDARELRRAPDRDGREYVLITGTHEPTPEVVNTLYREERRHAHGLAGSACPAATTAPDARSPRRSRRCSPTASTSREAVREAQDYTWQALKKAYRPGMGQYLPDRLFWAREDARPGRRARRAARFRCNQSRH